MPIKYVPLTPDNIDDAARTHAYVHYIGAHWAKSGRISSVSDDGTLVYYYWNGDSRLLLLEWRHHSCPYSQPRIGN